MLKNLNKWAIVLITIIITLVPLCYVSYNHTTYNWNGNLLYFPVVTAGILAMIFVLTTSLNIGKIIIATVTGFLITVFIKAQFDIFIDFNDHNLLGLEIILGGFYASIAAATGSLLGFLFKKIQLLTKK